MSYFSKTSKKILAASMAGAIALGGAVTAISAVASFDTASAYENPAASRAGNVVFLENALSDIPNSIVVGENASDTTVLTINLEDCKTRIKNTIQYKDENGVYKKVNVENEDIVFSAPTSYFDITKDSKGKISSINFKHGKSGKATISVSVRGKVQLDSGENSEIEVSARASTTVQIYKEGDYVIQATGNNTTLFNLHDDNKVVLTLEQWQRNTTVDGGAHSQQVQSVTDVLWYRKSGTGANTIFVEDVSEFAGKTTLDDDADKALDKYTSSNPKDEDKQLKGKNSITLSSGSSTSTGTVTIGVKTKTANGYKEVDTIQVTRVPGVRVNATDKAVVSLSGSNNFLYVDGNTKAIPKTKAPGDNATGDTDLNVKGANICVVNSLGTQGKAIDISLGDSDKGINLKDITVAGGEANVNVYGNVSVISAGPSLTAEYGYDGASADVTLNDKSTATGIYASKVNLNKDTLVAGNVEANELSTTVGTSIDGSVSVYGDSNIIWSEIGGNLTVYGGSTTVDASTIGGNVTAYGHRYTSKEGTGVNDTNASTNLTIQNSATDDNNNYGQTSIGGDVILNGVGTTKEEHKKTGFGKILIENADGLGAEKGAVTIGGNVIASYISTLEDAPAITVGTDQTNALIDVKGFIKGEYVSLGGNGFLQAAAVMPADERPFDITDNTNTAKEAPVASTLDLNAYNNVIESNLTTFDTVNVLKGSLVCDNLAANNLKVEGNLVASSVTVLGELSGSGNIATQSGALTILGSTSDTPTITLAGDQSAGNLAFTGISGTGAALNLNGFTVTSTRGERINNQYQYSYNYKDVTDFSKAATTTNLMAGIADIAVQKGTAVDAIAAHSGVLPEGYSIKWSTSAERYVNVAESNSVYNKLTGVEIGTALVTAQIVDADGRAVGQPARFNVEVFEGVVGNGIRNAQTTDEQEVIDELSPFQFDTKSKNMQVGDNYSVLLKTATPADAITVTSTNPAAAVVELVSEDYNGRGMLYRVTGVAEGTTQIVAKNANGVTVSTCDVKVGGFSLDTYNVNIVPGNTYAVLAVNVPATAIPSFTTSNAGVATVALDRAEYTSNRGLSGQLWRVTANSLGSATITGTYNNETYSFTVNSKLYWLDTANVKIAPGASYSVLAQNMTPEILASIAATGVTGDQTKVNVTVVNPSYTSGNKTGVLFQITAKEGASGETVVKIGSEEVNVVIG